MQDGAAPGLLVLAADLFNAAVASAVGAVSTARTARAAMLRDRASAAGAVMALAKGVCDIVGMNGFSLCRGTGRSMSERRAPSCRARKGIRNVLQ